MQAPALASPALTSGRFGRREPEHHEPLRLWIGKGAEQDPVHEAEDQGVGADAQRQREDDDERGARLPGGHAHGVAGILLSWPTKVMTRITLLRITVIRFAPCQSACRLIIEGIPAIS
jgi:hypothetical protein